YAADSGRVIFSGWYGGYGQTVIVDHGDGLSTLYAHASRLMVNEGQAVQQGQAIAAVGSTGLSTGPHLHFEVRQNGNPVNPAGYL
ncbi:MAG TPA: M23 family metallopeptidase, partial [Nodosilinea sp.]|nr:M23 family metallopeptidase [Nodosilinea sp.]